MLSNTEIARRWSIGKSGSNRNMSTDGQNLFSYDMCIGRTTESNRKVVLLVRGGYPYSFSRSTSQHVSEALRYADHKVIPTVTNGGGLHNGWRHFPTNWNVTLEAVSQSDAENAKDANGCPLHFACEIQDTETLAALREEYPELDFNSVLVGVSEGDYWPIYVRKAFPSHSADGQWYKVAR